MPVADPDLQIRVGGGGLQKKCFRPFGPQFGLKIRGRPGPLGPRAPEPPSPRAPGPRAPSLDPPQYVVLQNSKYRQPL